MPTFRFLCKKCNCEFDAYKKTMKVVPLNTIDKEVECEHCGKLGGKRIWPDQLDISIHVGQFLDRQEKKDKEYSKKVKDRDRAMRNRKRHFGVENVNVSKSDKARRKHTFKKEIMPTSQGTTPDIDKNDFIKIAAKNDKAVSEAQKALRKGG